MTDELRFDPRLLDAAAKYLCEISCYDNVREAWPHSESAPFVDNWHIGAMQGPWNHGLWYDRFEEVEE